MTDDDKSFKPAEVQEDGSIRTVPPVDRDRETFIPGKSVVTLVHKGKKEDDLDRLLIDLEAGYEAQVKIAKAVARHRKMRYDAHIEQGFTPEQALELCKTNLL